MTMTDEAPAAVDAGSGDAPEPASEKGKKGKKGKDKGAKSKSNLVPALVLAAGIAAGGYFMGGGNGAAATAETVEAADKAPEPGEYVTLEPLTVNLQGGRYLRVGVAFLMTKDHHVIAGDSHKGTPASLEPQDEHKVRDQLIAMFGGRTVESLVGAENLDAIKEELLERANHAFHDGALEVYLTEFVMQ